MEDEVVMDVREHVMAGIVRTRLGEDRRTGGQPIDVLVADGDIYLLGHVDSDDQRQAANLIVTGIVGVRQIVDHLVVRIRKPETDLTAVR